MTRWARLARHPVSLVGVAITTASAVTFIALAIAAAAGLFSNPYAGLVIFIALPAVFVARPPAGPARTCGCNAGGWARSVGRQLAGDRSRKSAVRRTTLAIIALSAVNVVILLVAGYGSLHSMESPEFCGQTCHTPMRPQFVAWQDAPHSRVACVECHVGEGARAFVHYKLAGARQLAHLITNSYPRPIPGAPEMRPGD